MKKMMCTTVAVLSGTLAFAGPLDKAWIKGTTDADPLTYKTGQTVTFTLTPQDVGADLPKDTYFLQWKRTGDDGVYENGKVPFTGAPFVYKTICGKAGFVRLEAYVVTADGKRYVKKFMGDATTPEGRRAMNAFERAKKNVFFDGGAGADIASLASHPEPTDFDAFWARQYKRLDLIPIKADRIELKSPNPAVRLYAVSIACAGLRPTTGYLSIPVAAEKGTKFPCRLTTHGYSGDSFEHLPPNGVRTDEIVLNMNAHGQKLPAFGATEADRKALRWECRSHDRHYAFDPQQNADPELAYFNGMVLRVKRGLQYLKTLPEWDGKNLIASGGSQGGLQTIWAAGCGEGVTRAESGITWCCDMYTNRIRDAKKMPGDGWYILWTDALGYYDPVNFARRIPLSCFTVITRAGLGDYCCPPMGLAKMWNNIKGHARIYWVQGSEHGYVPPKSDVEGTFIRDKE